MSPPPKNHIESNNTDVTWSKVVDGGLRHHFSTLVCFRTRVCVCSTVPLARKMYFAVFEMLTARVEARVQIAGQENIECVHYYTDC